MTRAIVGSRPLRSMVEPAGKADPVLRRRLRLALVLLGALAVGLTAVPFVASVTGRDHGAGPTALSVRLDGIGPGQARRLLWHGRPVWVVHRSPVQLKGHGGERYAAFFGYMDGCGIIYRGPGSPPAGRGTGWTGGFWNPCSGASYDVMGRRLGHADRGASRLARPSYRLDGAGRLVLGTGLR
ncbi:MAG TPA: hypothetical protein VKA50_09820 [Gammaproteobacteria bacterium]|nr:hypothetical protein [Gammaproteobacteria bacterium]